MLELRDAHPAVLRRRRPRLPEFHRQHIFSLLDQFGDHSGDGSYQVRYDPAVDSVSDTDPYPAATQQCPSPSGVATCVTDLQVQTELDKLIGAGGPGARGLTNN